MLGLVADRLHGQEFVADRPHGQEFPVLAALTSSASLLFCFVLYRQVLLFIIIIIIIEIQLHH